MARRPKHNRKRRPTRSEKFPKREKKRPALRARLTPRGDFTLFEHPRNVFQIEFPSDWTHTIEDDSRSIGFGPVDRDDVALSCYILPYSMDTDLIVESPKAVELCETLFARAGAVNPRRDATIPHFAMKADRNQKGMDGHYWFVAACDIFLGLSTYFPDGEQHIWNPVFERMLSTFRIPREMEAIATKAITRLLRKLKEEHPEEEYRSEEFELKGKSRTIPLGNLMARIRKSPGKWEALTDDFLESAVKVLHFNQLGNEQLRDVRDEIFPFIRPDSLGGQEGRLVKSEWLANLSVVYVIRIPKGFRYITEADLERWGLGREDLHQLAIANLTRLDTKSETPEFPAGSLPFVMVVAGDNMEASRLLNPGLYEQFAGALGGPFIAAIPSRDELILFPNNKELRRSVQQLVRKDFETCGYPITDRLFLVTPDGTTLAEW